MLEDTDITRFLEAQNAPYYGSYQQALLEVKNGKKTTHWIWYIFPQLRCLGRSITALYYGVADRAEAKRYIEHPILCERLREITEALLTHKGRDVSEIFGDLDAVKVRSSMTMFDSLSANDLFGDVLDVFYNGERCALTQKALLQERNNFEL